MFQAQNINVSNSSFAHVVVINAKHFLDLVFFQVKLPQLLPNVSKSNYKCFSLCPPPVDVCKSLIPNVPCLFLQIPTEYQQVAVHVSKVMDEYVREIAATVSKSLDVG
jgi:hypothetical protein